MPQNVYTQAELDEALKREGVIHCWGDASFSISGSTTVNAHDLATVYARGAAMVNAYGSAKVKAYDSATVNAHDLATVYAYDSATVYAYDSATVNAHDLATVYAHDLATVYAYDSATVYAYDLATVYAYDSATVEAYGSAKVLAYGSATVEAYGLAKVLAYGSATVYAYDSATIYAYGSAYGSAYGEATIHRVPSEVAASDSPPPAHDGVKHITTRASHIDLVEPWKAGEYDPPMQEWLQLPTGDHCPANAAHEGWGTVNPLGYFPVRCCHAPGCKTRFRPAASLHMLQRITEALLGTPQRLGKGNAD